MDDETDIIVGSVKSFNNVKLLVGVWSPLWFAAISFPTPSYILSSSGFTNKVSKPLGSSDKLIPKVYTFPLEEILVGIELDNVATPPLIDKVKSLASNAPLPPLVL